MFLHESKGESLRSTASKAAWISNRSERYPDLHIIFLASLTVPLSNAEVERGFSLMNWIKNKRRSSLGQANLFWLMLLAKYKDFSFDLVSIASKIAATWKRNTN